MVSVVIVFVNKYANSIVGGWETDTQIINSSSDNSNSGIIQFFFYEELTGKEITSLNDKSNHSNFTYAINNNELTITFESGSVWSFPFNLENNTLVLIQSHTAITYQRIVNLIFVISDLVISAFAMLIVSPIKQNIK